MPHHPVLPLVTGIRFASLYSATTEQSVYAQKTEMNKGREDTQDVNVETQMWEKPRQPTDYRKITMREEYNNGKA